MELPPTSLEEREVLSECCRGAAFFVLVMAKHLGILNHGNNIGGAATCSALLLVVIASFFRMAICMVILIEYCSSRFTMVMVIVIIVFCHPDTFLCL